MCLESLMNCDREGVLILPARPHHTQSKLIKAPTRRSRYCARAQGQRAVYVSDLLGPAASFVSPLESTCLVPRRQENNDGSSRCGSLWCPREAYTETGSWKLCDLSIASYLSWWVSVVGSGAPRFSGVRLVSEVGW